ncbi:MAG: hypothetical protein L6Q33_07705 [Bacteriovoracaceae bacterium]|jgi:hypothetical protein|nr:hypothetical protein [Bacteriovoracaceae bacterium]
MKMFLYLLVLFSLSTAIVELHASESYENENHFNRLGEKENTPEELSSVESRIEKRQIAHMLTLLEKSGRLLPSEAANAKRSLASLDGEELNDFKFQLRDLVNKN